MVLVSGCTSLSGLGDLSFTDGTGSAGGAATGGSDDVGAGTGGDGSGTTGDGGGAPGVGGGVEVDTTYREAVVASGPVSFWQLDETVGSVARDTMGNHDGVYEGGPALGEPGATDGGGAVALDGQNDQIVVDGSPFGFEGRSPFTLECWVRLGDTGGGDALGVLLSQNDFSGGHRGWALLVHPDQFLQLRRWASDAAEDKVSFNFNSDPAVVPLDQWTHVVTTFDGTTMRLFINASAYDSHTATVDVSAPPNRPLLMGNAISWANLTGMLDDVAIYTRALDGAEITAHYLAGSR